MNPPLKWHGGKHYLARRIVALMPPHIHYVEPFAGGLAVLLAKDPEGVSEVVNDLDRELTNFWRVLQIETLYLRFKRIIEAMPFSEREFVHSDDQALTSEWRAVNFFVRCRQSLAGRMKSFAPLSKNRTRRGMNEQVSSWLTAVEGLPEVHARLKRVAIVGPKDAKEVIRRQDGENTLFYCDPPYLHETRAAADVYAQEMSEEDHRQLLDLLRNVRGKVMLSGYRSAMYDAMLWGWRRADFDLPNNAASGESKRRMTECLWMNY